MRVAVLRPARPAQEPDLFAELASLDAELTVSVLPEGGPDNVEVSAAEVIVLADPGQTDTLEAIRNDPRTRGLPVVVHGSASDALALLTAGADLWIPSSESRALQLELARALLRQVRRGGGRRSDPLTGALAESSLRELLQHEFDRAVRYRRSVGVIVVELVLDKKNEDRVLPRLADELRGLVRDVDRLGRLSGTRFAAVLPETDAGGALAAAGRLARRLADSSTAGIDDAATGVAAYPARGMDCADDLLGRALEALQQARRKGGHAVVAFGAPNIIWARRAPDPSMV